MKSKFNWQQGFTLVELVLVIAILGVLSAVAVPFIASHLSESKDRAYEVDRERFQQAVEAFYSRPDNLNLIGKPQYPIIGMGNSRGTLVREDHDHDSSSGIPHDEHDDDHGAATPQSFDHFRISEDLTQLGNPLGGTQGGEPKWIDDGDGIRDGAEEEELLDNDSDSVNKPGWHVASVSREGTQYIVDSRDYFIDFDRLVASGLLNGVPGSASRDNRPQGPPTFVPLTSGNDDPFGFTMTPPTATAAMWIVDKAANKVFQYSTEGPLLDEFPLADSNQDATGIATDGSSSWVLDADDQQVYRYNLNGSPELTPFDITTASNDLVGIATDGAGIWILDSVGGVFLYSKAGVFQGQNFTLAVENSDASGLTTDGATIWVVDRDAVKVFRYTITGDLIGSFSVAPADDPEGIANDGANIWVVDKSDERIYPFGVEGGAPGSAADGLYEGSYSWYVNEEGKVRSLFSFFPQQDKTGFQTVYP